MPHRGESSREEGREGGRTGDGARCLSNEAWRERLAALLDLPADAQAGALGDHGGEGGRQAC